MDYLILIIPAVVFFLVGIRIVPPLQQGLIARFGTYYNLVNPGFHWIIPIVDNLYLLHTTETSENESDANNEMPGYTEEEREKKAEELDGF